MTEVQESPASVARQLVDLIDTGDNANDESVEQLTRHLLASVRQHLGMETAFISEFVGDHRVFRYLDSATSPPPFAPGDSDPRQQTACEYVAARAMPELVHDCRADPTAKRLDVTHQLPIGAHMSVPIHLSDGSIYGTFCCFKSTPDHELDERDLAVLRLSANVTVANIERHSRDSIQHHEIYERLQQRLAAGEPASICQPIMDLETHTPVGFELLSRFPMLPKQRPDQVLADAAAVGLTETVDCQCIARACEHVHRLPGGCFVSLNVSPILIRQGGLSELLAGLPHERLVVEITEHAVVHDYETIARELEPLRARGVRLAVDDAGAGYASFRHILDLEPDIVKLDMSLVRNVDTDKPRRALTGALTEFARNCGFALIAEGIETEAELRTLRSFGQCMGQGFLFARPEPTERWSSKMTSV